MGIPCRPRTSSGSCIANGYPEELLPQLFAQPHRRCGRQHGRGAHRFHRDHREVLYQRRMRVVRELGAVSSTDAGGPAETCRAVLRVLATARETMPFAVAWSLCGPEIKRPQFDPSFDAPGGCRGYSVSTVVGTCGIAKRAPSVTSRWS
jgi:hypothetical protein